MSLPTCTVNTNNIQNLPDSPTLDSNELKQEFDKSSKDLKDYLNEVLLPAVEELVENEKANLKTSINKIIADEKAKLEVSINDKILADNKKKYRIGKIIMSTDNTNPSVYLGFGTWVLWGSGRVPVGVNTNDTDFNTVEKTGGSKTTTVNFNHTHAIRYAFTSQYSNQNGVKYQNGETAPSSIIACHNSAWSDIRVPDIGTRTILNDKTWNNCQPYITCYMWKRTA